MLAAFLPTLNQCCSVSLQQLFLDELIQKILRLANEQFGYLTL